MTNADIITRAWKDEESRAGLSAPPDDAWTEKLRPSQQRAALRREAMRDEQAVTRWLRDLTRRGR